MPFTAFYSEHAKERIFWLVVHLKKRSLALALSDTMIERVAFVNDPNIFVDLHTSALQTTLADTVQSLMTRANTRSEKGLSYTI